MIIDNKDPENRFEHMLSKLRERGCRITSHRLYLLRLIAESEKHPSASTLYEHLHQRFPSASLATVYKTLALLKEEGEVQEIDLHGQSRYDGHKAISHPHLVCTKCGRIFDGEFLPAVDVINQQIFEKYGFSVSHQQQVFYGLCADCTEEKGTSSKPKKSG